ncbi:hypothetical protein GUK34_16655 [Rhizobium leguminosarum]|nr:hypothetical protein [Rhizobium ruizarguesonis]
MDRVIADMIPVSRIHYPVIFARLFGAIGFGGLIGFEREARDCPASCRALMSLCQRDCPLVIRSARPKHRFSQPTP